MRLLPLLLLTTMLPPLAHADRAADEASRQDALLRRYSTSEAEARMDAERRNPDAANQALGAGMSNLMNRMYRRGMANQESTRPRTDAELRDAYWKAVLAGQPVEAQDEREANLYMRLLVENSGEHRWQATQRLVEIALGLRADPDPLKLRGRPEYAASLTLDRTNGKQPLEGWALVMMGKFYLTGTGVPRDEEEAYRLFRYCAESAPIPSDEDVATIRARCRFNQATMLEQGWGVDADAKQAQALRAQAAAAWNQAKGSKLDLAQLEQRIQP